MIDATSAHFSLALERDTRGCHRRFGIRMGVPVGLTVEALERTDSAVRASFVFVLYIPPRRSLSFGR
jgi:hypothetical protein